MKLARLRVQNFRSFKDETIHFADYVCMVGPNGAGKSGVLNALNVFFRNDVSAATSVHELTEEDFHNRDTSVPVEITVTFSDLDAAEAEAFKHYFRGGELNVSAVARWNDVSKSAPVIQHGSRLGITDFARFFKMHDDSKVKAPALKEEFTKLAKDRPELGKAGSKAAMREALRVHEEAHPKECSLIASPAQFYGWSRGGNLLGEYVQWVYIPAVKDASTEQEEGAKTALGDLLKRTIRTRLDFDKDLEGVRSEAERSYREALEREQSVLDSVQGSVEARLRSWSTPSARLSLNWHFDPKKSVVVNEPLARVQVGDGGFIGEVARLGHGMQRAFILAMLQELAESGQEGQPKLILGFEEPELYQHPPQAQHMASTLDQMSSGEGSVTQVVLSTHSPYFVTGKGFQSVRMFRKAGDGQSVVTQATFEDVSKRLSDALGEKPAAVSAFMSKLQQVLQPSQRELFFAQVPVLVEGVEDVAFLAAHLQLTGRWDDFRKLGLHFVVCGGKTSMSRPLAVCVELGLPVFAVFDADGHETKATTRASHKKNNRCLLALCGHPEQEPLPEDSQIVSGVVMWSEDIGRAVRADVGKDAWEAAEARAREKHGFEMGVGRKSVLLIAATMEELHGDGIVSALLTRACDEILVER